MGGSQSKPHQAHVFNVQDWQPIHWQPYTNIKDPTFSSNFTVYAHKSNPNLQIEKYQLFFNSQAEYISYLETYYDRKRFPTLVNSMHIEQTTKKNMCSTFYSASVYLQRIHFRLFELIQIPVQQGLYIIEAALEGYEKMFQKTGYFQVSTDMIGVNKQGKVKVWINKNFAKNFPEFNKIDHNKSEGDFIRELIRVIQESIDYPNHKQKFSEYLKNKKTIPTFQFTRMVLKQYQKFYRYSTQKSMKSIILWVKKQTNKPMHNNTSILQQFKTSTYSSTSQKNTASNKTPYFHNTNKKIQFNKLKTRRSNNKPIEISKFNIPHNDELFDLNLGLNLNSKNNNNSRNNNQIYFNKQRESEPDRISGNYNRNICLNFYKNERKFDQIQGKNFTQNNFKNSNKTMNKLPSVSFSYKSSGLYSPQNIDSHQSEWFGLKKTQKTSSQASQKTRQKQLRKSLTFNISEDLDQKMKFYYNNSDICEIDPDIAKDLFSMTNLNK